MPGLSKAAAAEGQMEPRGLGAKVFRANALLQLLSVIFTKLWSPSPLNWYKKLTAFLVEKSVLMRKLSKNVFQEISVMSTNKKF